MASCAHHPDSEGDGMHQAGRGATTRPESAASEIQKQLEAEYRRWRGTRHRLGGNSRSGIDCSGFVKAVYKNIFDMDLPRTTRAQAALGRPVKREHLQAGDLVFFTPPLLPSPCGDIFKQRQVCPCIQNQRRYNLQDGSVLLG